MSSERVHEALLARLESRPPEPAAGPGLRAEAAQIFRDAGWPGAKLEAWRFTPLRALEQLDWQRPDGATPDEAPALPEIVRGPLAEFDRLVFLDGRLVATASMHGALPPDTRFGALGPALLDPEARLALGAQSEDKSRAASALNTALFEDGAHVVVPPGAELERPIVLLWLTSGARRLVNPRARIELGAGSRAQIVEVHAEHAGEAACINAVSEVHLGEGAELDHVHVQEQAAGSVHLAELAVHQEAGSRLRSHSLALGGALARVEIRTELAGEGAHAQLHGLYRGRDSQVLDHFTTIDHAAPHTTSEELYKGILDGRAKGVFCGRVHVRPHAQKIDAAQTNRALLLTDSATVHTRPQLEIYADDVRCSHGASIGQLDDAALFYLRARGIGLEEARALLMAAFVEDVLDSLPVQALRDPVRAQLFAEGDA